MKISLVVIFLMLSTSIVPIVSSGWGEWSNVVAFQPMETDVEIYIEAPEQVMVGGTLSLVLWINPHGQNVSAWVTKYLTYDETIFEATMVELGTFWGSTGFSSTGYIDNDNGEHYESQSFTITESSDNLTAFTIHFDVISEGTGSFDCRIDVSKNSSNIKQCTDTVSVDAFDSSYTMLWAQPNNIVGTEQNTLRTLSNYSCYVQGQPSIGENLTVNITFWNISKYIPEWEVLCVFETDSFFDGEIVYNLSDVMKHITSQGNTTFYWKVNVSDGVTYTVYNCSYTTYSHVLGSIGNARYDINNDVLEIDVQDLVPTWENKWQIGDTSTYWGLYDVTADGNVTTIDLSAIWSERTTA